MSSSFGFLPAPAIETGVRATAQRLAPREGFRAVTPPTVASWSATSDICADGLFGISAPTRVIRRCKHESCEILRIEKRRSNSSKENESDVN